MLTGQVSKMFWTKRLVFLLYLLTLAILTKGQGQTSPGEDFSNGQGRETGLLFTVTATCDDNVHLIHLPYMPFYQRTQNALSVPAWQISDPSLDFLSADVDFRNDWLYTYDRASRTILVTTGYQSPQVDGLINGGIYYFSTAMSDGQIQIAYDWLSNTLYWVDSGLRQILATSGNMTRHFETVFLHFDLTFPVVTQDLYSPDGVSVDPLAGYLFFSDSGIHPKIERVLLDGSDRHTFSLKGLARPMSVECDIFEQRVYWVDQLEETVEYMNYDGTGMNRARLLHGTRLGDLAIFRDVLIVTDVDPDRGRAYFINKTSGLELEDPLEFKKNYLYGVVVYNIENYPLKQYGASPNCSMLNCDHLCISMPDKPKCICYAGYELNTTTNLCDEKEGNTHKGVIVVTDHQMCVLDIRVFNDISQFFTIDCKFNTLTQENITSSSTTRAPPTTAANGASTTTSNPPYDPAQDPDNFITMVTLDTQRRVAYYATQGNSVYRRAIDLQIDNWYREMVFSTTGTINGMVFDWVNKNNLYWIESDTQLLLRFDTTTNSRSTVLSIPEGTPSFLIMMYRQRKLAWWSQNVNGTYDLMTVGIDGGNKMMLLSGRTGVISLTNDDEYQMLYWLEGSLVMSIDYAASSGDPQSVVDTGIAIFELLIHHKNYLAWAFPSNLIGTQIQTFNIHTGQAGATGSLDLTSRFNDWKVLDITLTPENITASNPCSVNNGGCDQICINKFTAGSQTPVKTCSCTLGFYLGSDGMQCNSDYSLRNYALVTDITYQRIYQIDLVTNEIHALNFPQSSDLNGVFYDTTFEEVLWSDGNNVMVADINGDNARILDSGPGTPSDYAVDETTGHLYYAANEYPWEGYVNVLTYDGYWFVFWENYLLYQDTIVAIDTHPYYGWLYGAIRSNYFESYIIRSNLDGTNITRFELNVPITYPLIEGLVIDHSRDLLYWTEHDEDKIYQCDLNVQNCQVLYHDPDVDIREIDTDAEYVYYTARNSHHLKRLSLTTSPKQVTKLGESIELGKLESVSIYKPNTLNKQRVNEACRYREGKGDCSTICFPTETGRTCACENANVTLLADNRTCSNVFQCNASFMETSTSGLTITVSDDCLRYVDEECQYTCPGTNAPVSIDHVLRCTSTGWDRQRETLCKDVECVHKITNGRISKQGCNYNIGETCSYECDQGFYMNPNINSLRCNNAGTWQPVNSGANSSPCIDVYCPLMIPNGQVTTPCNQQITSTCGYTCNTNYRKKANVATLTCQSNGAWDQSADLCEEILCPNTVGGATVSGSCNRTISSLCTFSCATGAIMNKNVSQLMCLATGAWNQTSNLCSSMPSIAAAQTSDNSKEVGLGVGLAVLGLFLLLLIILVIVFRGRLMRCGKKDSNIPPATFSNDPIDGIENPGYVNTTNSAISVRNDMYEPSTTSSEHDYSTISDKGARDKAYHYDNTSTLPEKKEIDPPKGDTAYLTYDSWLKQQQKNGKE